MAEDTNVDSYDPSYGGATQPIADDSADDAGTADQGPALPQGTVGIQNDKGDLLLMKEGDPRIDQMLKKPGFTMTKTMPAKLSGGDSDSATGMLQQPAVNKDTVPLTAQGQAVLDKYKSQPAPITGIMSSLGNAANSMIYGSGGGGAAAPGAPAQAPVQQADAAGSGGAQQLPNATPGAPGGQALDVDQTRTAAPAFNRGGGQGAGGMGGGLIPYEKSDEQNTKSLSPEAQQAYQDQVDAENESMGKVRDYLHAQADVNIAAANNRAAVLQQQTDEIHANRMAQQQEFQRRLSEIDDTTNQLKKMSIDPDRAYGHGATPSKILAGLGVVMGAIGAGHTGQPNQAIGIINDAINRDIEVQKADIARVQGIGEMQRGGLSAYMKVVDSENTARNLEHARQLELADAQVAKLQAGISDQKNAATLAQIRMGLAQEHTKFMASATGDVHVATTKSMMPGMMGKTDNGVNKDITDSDRMGQRFDDAADEIDESLKTGQGPASAGTFTKALNDLKRKVGGDNPALTAKMEEWQNLYVDQAVKQGLTRKEGMAKFEDIVGRATDNPKTLSALFRNEAKTERGDSEAKRQQYGGMGYRLPGRLHESQSARQKRLGAKKNPTVGQ